MDINIIEIARRAGVSTATVSRALNNNGPVREETRQKILQIARELNYKPNPIARSLSRKQTDTIGVILHVLIIFMLLQKYYVQGIMLGGVKE